MIHTIGRKADEHYLAPHPHDTVAQARECEEQHAADIEGHLQAQAELATEQRYERWLEDGGAAGERIRAEDEIEREREAHDPFLQALRRGREMGA